MKNKRLAVVVSGWHYPYHFYKTIKEQYVPIGWEVDLFCISHRDPSHAEPEVKAYLKTLGRNLRAGLDRKLYKKVITRKQLERMGWTYLEKPNTTGDWGNTNQWLEDYNYKDYDLFLFTHDDNLILNYQLFHNVIEGEDFKDWLILSNSTGMPAGYLRGSFEFFKPELLDMIGGKFDLSESKLTRVGETDNPSDTYALTDWNFTVYPLARFLIDKGLQAKVHALSPCYRVSMYCIEGERGFISKSHGINTEQENHGLALLQHHKII